MATLTYTHGCPSPIGNSVMDDHVFDPRSENHSDQSDQSDSDLPMHSVDVSVDGSAKTVQRHSSCSVGIYMGPRHDIQDLQLKKNKSQAPHVEEQPRKRIKRIAQIVEVQPPHHGLPLASALVVCMLVWSLVSGLAAPN